MLMTARREQAQKLFSRRRGGVLDYVVESVIILTDTAEFVQSSDFVEAKRRVMRRRKGSGRPVRAETEKQK